tara:strand:+ start:1567 stop:1761 length:195 start_codon:yes stop_codon:yes gene_type:complete
MALRNAETIVHLTTKIQGNLTNLKMMANTQRPVDEFVKKIEQTEEVLRDLETQLDREHAALRNG